MTDSHHELRVASYDAGSVIRACTCGGPWPCVTPLSAEEEAEEREDHHPRDFGPGVLFCAECDYRWPCPTARLLATLDATRQPTALLAPFAAMGGDWAMPAFHDLEADIVVWGPVAGRCVTAGDVRAARRYLDGARADEPDYRPATLAATPPPPDALREALDGLVKAVIAMKRTIPLETGLRWRPFLDKTGDVNVWLDVAEAALAPHEEKA